MLMKVDNTGSEHAIPLVSYELLEDMKIRDSKEEFVGIPMDLEMQQDSNGKKVVKSEMKKRDVQLVIDGPTFKVVRAHYPELVPKVNLKMTSLCSAQGSPYYYKCSGGCVCGVWCVCVCVCVCVCGVCVCVCVCGLCMFVYIAV